MSIFVFLKYLHFKPALTNGFVVGVLFAVLGAGVLEILLACFGAMGTWVAAAFSYRSKKETREREWIQNELKRLREADLRHRDRRDELESEVDRYGYYTTRLLIVAERLRAQLEDAGITPSWEIPNISGWWDEKWDKKD